MPLFYATVELTGGLSRRPLPIRRLDCWICPGFRDEIRRDQGIFEPAGLAGLSTKQQNGLGQNVSRIALHESSLKGSAFAMTEKRRRPNSADVQIGESIRAHRLIMGMSQSDLAGRLGVSFQQIQKYEKGTNRVGAGRLPLIAKIFNIPIVALFDANADASPGKSTGTTPVKLIPDRNSLKLLTAFGDIGHHRIRHSLVGLVDAIAKATPKTPR